MQEPRLKKKEKHFDYLSEKVNPILEKLCQRLLEK